MDRNQCKKFDSCGAPLCPLDKGSLEHGIWYSDEESCESVEFRMMPWVKRQRKINKKATNDKYFTYGMLDRDIIIRKGIEGIDADRDEASQLTIWLKNHEGMKAIRVITTEQKQRLVEEGKKYQLKRRLLSQKDITSSPKN